MDAIDTLLNSLDVSVELVAVCDVDSGCYLDLQPSEMCSIHYVLSGNGVLTTNSGREIALEPDQMILIPIGMPQRIQSTVRSTENLKCNNRASICLQPSENLKWLSAGSGDTDIVLACGQIHATYGDSTNLFGLLDQPIVESFSDSKSTRHAFEAILHEFCEPVVGTPALTSTLMKQCLITLLRRLHLSDHPHLPWLNILEKPGLMRAVQAIISKPELAYRVEDLAAIALMSRSAFTQQFSRTIGQPPHEFLSNYRLRRAASLLMTTDLPVKSIAVKVGYQSRSSFSRAFKSLYQLDPNSYRSDYRSR